MTLSNGGGGGERESEKATLLHFSFFSSYGEEEIATLTATDVRPRACYRLQWDQLVVGNRVMVNYNSDNPKERGFWYDAVITRKDSDKMELYGKLLFG